MKIGFFVNAVETELEFYTTTRLAHAAVRGGHDVWYIGAEDFAFAPDGRVIARATRAPDGDYPSHVDYFRALKSEGTVKRRIDVRDLDVLMLRNDPAEDQGTRPWAQSTGILFGHAAALRDVVVLNDPTGLSMALNKMYLQHFPREVRPDTLITRDPEELRGFAHAHREGAIFKPLQGSGGESVFLVRAGGRSNLNQIVDAVRRFGYVIAQEYLPEASERDTRLFLLNGRPLEAEGRICAFSRIGAEGEVRTNMSAGGVAAPAEIDDRTMELAELVRPRLVQDGMFLVGLDIAGGKVMEINVFSPGGLECAGELEGVDFTVPVFEAIEAKLRHRDQYDRSLPNRELAVL